MALPLMNHIDNYSIFMYLETGIIQHYVIVQTHFYRVMSIGKIQRKKFMVTIIQWHDKFRDIFMLKGIISKIIQYLKFQREKFTIVEILHIS